jgi:histidinol-phosphate aminotransferase
MTLVPKYIKNLSPYIPGKRIEDIKLNSISNKIIKLSSNENPFGPSKKAIKILDRCFNKIHRYPDSAGLLLREKISKIYDVKIDNVILGSGSEGIMSAIIRTFLNDKDEIIGSENSFIGFRVLANSSGRKINWVKTNNFHYDLDAIANKINSKTKIIYLANPDNPSGTYFNKINFEKFMRKVPERVLVILDEAYFEYAKHINDYPDSMIYRFDNVITLRTFSKGYGLAGLRVGYGIAHRYLISNLLKVKLPFEPSSPAQLAAFEALDDHEHLTKSIESNLIGIKYLTNEFDLIGIKYIPTSANFITIILENHREANLFVKFMLKNGIILRHLKGFGLESCVRITIGTMNEIKFFIKILNIYES